MNQPHKHKDVIIAWANGEKIEFLPVGHETWIEVNSPNWFENVQYRVKPKKVTRQFRVALLKSDHDFYTFTADSAEEVQKVEHYEDFVAWLTDPIPYQVEELN